jgi:hypothetical protein
MNYIEQEIVIEGTIEDRPGLSISLGGDVFRRLTSTIQPSVRMALTGRSSQTGQPPRWLQDASDVRVKGFSNRDEDTVMHLVSPTLGDAAPKAFEQARLWDEGVRPDETALDVMARLIQDVHLKSADSNAYDNAMLMKLTKWRGVLETRVRGIVLPSQNAESRSRIDDVMVANAQILSDQIPTPRQIRLVGKLDMIRYSTRSAGLLLDSGDEIRCAFVNEAIDDLKQFLNEEVTLLGKAIYRPSGSVLRIDVEEILRTTMGRTQFSSIPSPSDVRPRRERKLQNARSGVSAIFGTWPGEESDEELLAALAELG